MDLFLNFLSVQGWLTVTFLALSSRVLLGVRDGIGPIQTMWLTYR